MTTKRELEEELKLTDTGKTFLCTSEDRSPWEEQNCDLSMKFKEVENDSRDK